MSTGISTALSAPATASSKPLQSDGRLDGQDGTIVLGPCAACALPCHTPSVSTVHAGNNPTHSRNLHCTSTLSRDVRRPCTQRCDVEHTRGTCGWGVSKREPVERSVDEWCRKRGGATRQYWSSAVKRDNVHTVAHGRGRPRLGEGRKPLRDSCAVRVLRGGGTDGYSRMSI